VIMVEEDLLPLPRKGVSVIPIRSNFGLLHAFKMSWYYYEFMDNGHTDLGKGLNLFSMYSIAQ